ncbi:hypothetical protein ZWY2020_009746 [Hordeum vulgare]|nr:hypothetical protein ZWY2020_009746 [Hordeum vulgare]
MSSMASCCRCDTWNAVNNSSVNRSTLNDHVRVPAGRILDLDQEVEDELLQQAVQEEKQLSEELQALMQRAIQQMSSIQEHQCHQFAS